MNKVEYFALEETPNYPGKYNIRFKPEAMPQMHTAGSFNILPARLMNLSYAQYLRFCRDVIGGVITGKKQIYPAVYFEHSATAIAFVRLLNTRMNFIMWEREHPDWREHQDYLEKKQEALKHVSDSEDA